MAGERVTLWTSVAAAGATFVAVAISAAFIWNSAGKQRTQFVTELAAINAKLEAANVKIDKASATVTEIKKITALETTTKALDQLNAGLKTTNAGLAKLQQTSSLDGIKNTLAKLDSKIDKTDAALAGLKKSTAAIDAKLAATDKSLADIKTAKRQENGTQTAGDAARDQAIAKLETTIGELKTSMADNASTQNKWLTAIANSIVAMKASAATQTAQVTKAAQAAQAAAQKAEKDVAVARAPEPPASEITSSIPIAQPLTVHFDDAGRANLAGQTNAVIGSLKTIMKGRHSCAISVAGYSDTLGRDDVNLDVSKERADMIAAKLKTAFAGQNVRIDSVGWGERKLKIWTPDGKREMANRRVEVSADCKG